MSKIPQLRIRPFSRTSSSTEDDVRTVHFDAAGRSNSGRIRNNNEDSFLIVNIPETNDLLMAVADGIGGGEAGETASLFTMQELLRERIKVQTQKKMHTIADAENVLVRGIENANISLEHLNSNLGGRHFVTGTTVAAMILLPHAGVIAHAGDSRCYQWRDNNCHQLTQDHTWAQNLVEIGELEKHKIRGHPWEHTLSNCLGTLPEIELTIQHFEHLPGDRYILCSDGLTQMLDHNEINAIVTNNDTSASIAEKLIIESLREGGNDNITVTVAQAPNPHIA